jgi:mevalonate kinase
MKKQGRGQAHAKLILIGEHAVVYGHPGIALPFFPLKVDVQVTASQEDFLISSLYQGPISSLPTELIFIGFLLDHLKTTLKLGPLEVVITNTIPSSAGMGSSAAISGAIVEALYDIANVPLDAKLRFEHTQLTEKLVHGSASGIDALTTASTNGWYFIKGKDPEPIVITLPAYLVVAHSGIKGSTKEAVGKVAKLFTQNLAQGHLESIGLMSLLMKEAIEKKEIDDVARLMNQTQFHLQELGVSHPAIDAMVSDAIQLGALGAKLTGGGLGGSMIALVDDRNLAERIILHFKRHHTKEVWLMDLRS